nr:phospholipase-like protein [Tanacetum cinerariifolium]
MLCRQIDDENVPLNYYINNDLHIQFGREEFCLATGLRFGVENREEYDTQANLPFRRRVFSSHLNGKPITGIDVANVIVGPTFAKLYDEYVVGLCCLGILQLVLLGAESRRNVPEWLLRIANDRVAWKNYPWGSYMWPTLYSQLKNANVRRWGPLAYFDGSIDQVERVPFDLSCQNMYEIPSDIYRQFVEQKIELERNRKDFDDIKEQMLKCKEEMNARSVRQENTEPINGGLSLFKGHANSSFFNMGTPSNFQTPMRSQHGSSDWQRQMPEQSASQYWQPSPQPGSYYSFGQVPSHIGRPNLQTTIETQHDFDGLVDQNIPNRGKCNNFLASI